MNESLFKLKIGNRELLVFFDRTSFLQDKIITTLKHKGAFSRYKKNYISNEIRIYIKIPFSKTSLLIFLKKETLIFESD